MKESTKRYGAELLDAPQKAFDLTKDHGLSPIPHYLDAIKHNRFVRCCDLVDEFPQFGHTTSNISESLNSIFTKKRRLPVLHCVNALWRDKCPSSTEGGSTNFPSDQLTKTANNYYQEQLLLLKPMHGYIVTPSAPNVALVLNPSTNRSARGEVMLREASTSAEPMHKNSESDMFWTLSLRNCG